MSTLISGNGKLLEEKPKFSRVIRVSAHLLSWIFHPLFIPLYVTIFLSYIHPYAFVALSERGKIFKLIFVFVNTALFPGMAVFLMWRLKFTQSIFLRTQKERIIPYAAAMVFYFWAWYVSRSLQDNEKVFTGFLFGSFLTVIAAWMANIYFKVSMHAIAMGGMVCFFILLAMQGSFSMGIYLSAAIFVAGLVCTCRLLVSDHYPFEVYAGFLLGVISQGIATWFV